MIYLFFAAVCVSLLFYAVFFLFISKVKNDKIKMRQRLAKLSRDEGRAPQTLRQKKRSDRPLSRFAPLFSGAMLGRIQSELSIAGVMLRAEEFAILWIAIGIVIPALFFLLTLNILVALGFAVFGIIVPPVFIMESKKKKMALFKSQLADALIVISNCLKAGFTFQQAMESVVSEMPDPISKEFGKALREVKLGVPMEEALQNMVTRLRDEDLDLLVSAVVIQKQVGGNLADILDSIADTIKERLRIRGEIKVLTSSGRTSGLIVGLMPVFLLAFLMIINPSYVSVFFTTAIGTAMLAVATVMEIIGFLVIRKIVNVKF